MSVELKKKQQQRMFVVSSAVLDNTIKCYLTHNVMRRADISRLYNGEQCYVDNKTELKTKITTNILHLANQHSCRKYIL
jgi:hypothetical protein